MIKKKEAEEKLRSGALLREGHYTKSHYIIYGDRIRLLRKDVKVDMSKFTAVREDLWETDYKLTDPKSEIWLKRGTV
jgi:hypothetical protein